MTEDSPKIRNQLRGGQVREWRDEEGQTWRIWLLKDEKYSPGALLSFAGLPKEVMDAPKVLVRGLHDVLTVPDGMLGFYLRAAREGGFVWRDRDGLPWHFSAELILRSPTGHELCLRHPSLHRPLWGECSDTLQELVQVSPMRADRGDWHRTTRRLDSPDDD